jgi:hypothetical protein
MERPKGILVIYRLKFKFEHDFEKAVQTFRFGQNMARYVESLQRSFALQHPGLDYPMITTAPAEVNFCKEDLVIYLCSYELKQYTKTSPTPNNIIKGASVQMPRVPYCYELFLKGTFGQTADVLVAASEDI